MLEAFDPTSIEDPGLRTMVVRLMNVVEKQHALIAEQAAELQRLRDEISRLKGEQGKPTIKANTARPDLSSEKQRRESKPHRKGSKQAQISIDREEMVQVAAHQLPCDAVFKGYEEVVVQDVLFRTDNILFRKEKYYSPSQRQTYLAALPAGYHGQFGPGVRAWVLALYYEGAMSEPKILEVLQTVGVHISAGQLSDLLIKRQEVFHAERAAVVRAGLLSSPWQHLDSTGTRVNGFNQHCHVLCNPLYSFYCTTPSKDRLSMLRVLQPGAALGFQFTAKAPALLEQLGVNPIWITLLTYHLAQGQVFTQEQLEVWLSTRLPKMGPTVRRLVKDALAIAYYHNQSASPVVSLLLCDDASQFHALTTELALCWVHEFRHYKKLLPRFSHHCRLLQEFGTQFWQLYHDLLDYRQHPDPAQAATLRDRFDQLFTSPSGYQDLDSCKARTLRKREPLLLVLSHPEILLHNNPAELAARQRVRKRDVSLQARTGEGIAAWDTFQTLVATAKKLGVNLFSYFYDRLSHTCALPSFATLIEQRAPSLALGSSWQQAP
jgi:transposase IS66 family protein